MISLIAASASFAIPWLFDWLFHEDEIVIVGYPNGRRAIVGNTGDGTVHLASIRFRLAVQASATRNQVQLVLHTMDLHLEPGEIKSAKINEARAFQLEMAVGFLDEKMAHQLKGLAVALRCVEPVYFSADDQLYKDFEEQGWQPIWDVVGHAKFYSIHEQQFREIEIPFKQALGVHKTPECEPVLEYLTCGRTGSKRCRFAAPDQWIADAKDDRELALMCLTAPSHCEKLGRRVDVSWFKP